VTCSRRQRRTSLLIAGALAGGWIATSLVGCEAAVLVGGMMESYRQTSTRTVEAQYEGLEGKSVAVMVAADRLIQSTDPRIVARLTTLITERLVSEAGVSGFVPPTLIVEYQLNNPTWAATPYSEIAEEFGVDRLVFIDLYEYRLHEPGNAYLWSGLASANVGVIEADGALADDFVFTRHVSVKYPDERGLGPTDLPANQVAGQVQRRFLDRVTWLFYDHQEPYYPDY